MSWWAYEKSVGFPGSCLLSQDSMKGCVTVMAQRLQYRFTNDVLFKILFSRIPELLKQLVAGILGIRMEDITDFEVVPSEIPPEVLAEKYLHLDIKMMVDEKLIDLEVQVVNRGDYKERSLFNWASMFSSALPVGGRYADLPQVVVISILDFKLFKCENYHSQFQVLETSRGELLSDKLALHYIEVGKLPKTVSGFELLLSLFRARTVEDLELLKESEVPIMSEVIETYWEVTGDAKFREIARLREQARHDEASALGHEREKVEKKWQRMMKRVTTEKDAVITKKDAVIAKRDAEIARLASELAQLRGVASAG
jgi:predicted transposase/invertase (TIGR01784 family)